MEEQLTRLENKILETIDRMQELRRDNERLGAKCATMQERLRAIESENEGLRQQVDAAREAASQFDDLEAKKRLIEQKVGGLIAKLEAMG